MTTCFRIGSTLALCSLIFSVACGDNDGPNNQDPLPPGPDAAPPVVLDGTKAHWVTENTLAIPGDLPGSDFALYYAAAGGIDVVDEEVTGADDSLALSVDSTGLSQDVKDKFPHLAAYTALTIASGDIAMVPGLLRGELLLASTSGDELAAATRVQIPGVLDDLYTYDGDDLGVTCSGDPAETPSFALWAPTAVSVKLHIFDTDEDRTAITDEAEVMVDDDNDGVWTFAADDNAWYGKYYLYEVEVYAPSMGEVVNNMVTDPYSLGLATNSEYSLIVNLEDDATKPAGWDELEKPGEFVDKEEDIVLYEIHIRDFSIYDQTVAADHRGKYAAFTYNEGEGGDRELSDGMRHLQNMADAGLTHAHLLPTFDIATIEEDPADRIDINVAESFKALCDEQKEADATVAEADCDAMVNAGKTISEIFQDLLDDSWPIGDTTAIQSMLNLFRDQDAFNWGYDPFHYTTPEGSYATDPEGMTRILEFREMVMGLSDIGLRTVMDVVYNHTNASGQNDKSVLDKVVPGYYHRLNQTTGFVERSTCCENTATEHNMMQKLMVDSLIVWAEQYKIDGFRFDLMGHHMKRNLEEVQTEMAAIDPNIYIYGEGWDFGEVVTNTRGPNATQFNMAGTGIGTFSDRLRDAARGGGPFDNADTLRINQGFTTGLYYDRNEMVTATSEELMESLVHQTDLVRVGLAGNLENFVVTNGEGTNVAGKDVDYNGFKGGYTSDPQEVITYVAAHDNQTLFDNNQYKLPIGTPSAERTRVQNLGNSLVLMGQGVPFIHMGQDMLRSKAMQRDSYNSGDWYNKVDFTYQTNNWNVGLPREDKDGDNYELIRKVIADTSITPTSRDIQSAVEHTLEMLRIRKSSPLFRLRTGEDVQTRVDFHNVGEDQKPGLIVMSITDGTCADGETPNDLDPNYDNILVIFNANDEEQSFAAAGLEGFALHPVQVDSVDPVVRETEIDEEGSDTTFTVPGRTTAVFVQAQATDRREGLCNEKSAEEVKPPGGDVSADVYVRGTLTDPEWDSLALKFAKVDEATYEVTAEGLTAGTYSFKVADESYGTHNWGGGGGAMLSPGDTITLDGGGDVTLNIPADGDYKFTLDTTNLNTPDITLEAL